MKLSFSRVLGLLLIAAGALILFFGLPKRASPPQWRLTKEYSWSAGEPGFPAISTQFPLQSLAVYRLDEQGKVETRFLSVATFREQDKPVETALLNVQPLNPVDPTQKTWTPERHFHLWEDAAKVLREHAEANAIIVGWWDTAQRLRLLTGLTAWIQQPAKSAYFYPAEQEVWLQLGGTASDKEDRSRAFAQWLTGNDVDHLPASFPHDRPVYLVVTADDLAHLPEMEWLGGRSIPLRSQVFPLGKDIHGVINTVKHWVESEGSKAYLLQPQTGGDIRVWVRPAERDLHDAVLLQLLPFTDSSAVPPKPLQLVYQSARSGFLSIYKVIRD